MFKISRKITFKVLKAIESNSFQEKPINTLSYPSIEQEGFFPCIGNQ